MPSERHILLISNSSMHGSGYLEYCSDAIMAFLGPSVHTVLFIPYALADHDRYAGIARGKFKEMGYDLISIHEMESKEQAVRDAESFFIGGGNTFRLLSQLYNHNILELIRKKVFSGTPYIGTSAGSNVACCTIKTTNDMPIVYPCSFNALHIVPFNLNPHYLDPDPLSTHMGETCEQRIKEFHEENQKVVVGLREGGILRIKSDTMMLEQGSARIFFPDGRIEEYLAGTDLSLLLA